MSYSSFVTPALRAPRDATDRTRLGATVTADGTDFVVAAPHASAVDLCLFSLDTDGTIVAETRVGMHGPARGLWGVHLPDIGAGQRYGYRAHGERNPSEGLLYNPCKLLLDPYARALDGEPVLGPSLYAHQVDANLCPTSSPPTPSSLDSAPDMALGVVTGPSFAVVPGPRVPRERTVIYETHVKGLTLGLPDVPESLRGTYAGLAHPATVAYLKDLGITTIELLPIHAAFSETFLQAKGMRNYWGGLP